MLQHHVPIDVVVAHRQVIGQFAKNQLLNVVHRASENLQLVEEVDVAEVDVVVVVENLDKRVYRIHQDFARHLADRVHLVPHQSHALHK